MGSIQGFKGFDKNLMCLGFQYEVGKQYKIDEEPICCCRNGFHICENPLDTFNYYPPVSSRFCKVRGDGKSQKGSGDSKIAVSRIRIDTEIGLGGIIEAATSFISKQAKSTKGNQAHAATTGYRAHAATTGDFSHAATTGCEAHAATTGCEAHAATTGYMAHAATTGNQAHAATTGYRAHAATTGDFSHAATTGDLSHAAATGDFSHAATTGCGAHAVTIGSGANASVMGGKSVAVALGVQSRAKAALGSWIVLAEWGLDKEQGWHIIRVKSAKVDGNKIKPDTFYELRKGRFVEYVR